MNMSVTGVTSGAVYPTGVLTRTGAGMDVFLYPSAGMGVFAGIIFSDGYGCGTALPSGYVPVAIPTHKIAVAGSSSARGGPRTKHE